jgi:2,4-dienoyl-CoA reductase-like NADH-dependent reductase (Old Yellow Enzyme family)
MPIYIGNSNDLVAFGRPFINNPDLVARLYSTVKMLKATQIIPIMRFYKRGGITSKAFMLAQQLHWLAFFIIR